MQVMQDYKQIFTLCLLLVFSLFLTHTSFAQLNAEVIGDAEITGDLKIRYSNPDNSTINMLILERFQPSFTFLGVTYGASINKWSLDLPAGIFNFGNNLNFNYNGNTKLAFSYATGEINRPQTGSSDLLPYAYGKIATDGTNTLAGTLANYTVSRANNFYTLISFDDPVADQLVINVTPEVTTPGEFPPLATQVGIRYGTSSAIAIYIFDSNGNVMQDAGFSFIAYKP